MQLSVLKMETKGLHSSRWDKFKEHAPSLSIFQYLQYDFWHFYKKLEDDPRSTPGHSKVLDQIRAIIKLMIVVSTVGLTKKLLKCYVDVQKHLEQLLKYPNQS